MDILNSISIVIGIAGISIITGGVMLTFMRVVHLEFKIIKERRCLKKEKH